MLTETETKSYEHHHGMFFVSDTRKRKQICATNINEWKHIQLNLIQANNTLDRSDTRLRGTHKCNDYYTFIFHSNGAALATQALPGCRRI